MAAAPAIRSLVAASARWHDPVQEIVQDLYGGCPGTCTLKHKQPMKRKNKHGSNKARAAAHGGLNLSAQPDAAGIDIGAQELVAAVPAGRCEGQSVRSFSSFTSGVEALRDWLLECKIATVALESTGNYWITCYSMLEDAGIEVWLVNARHVKGVPGKKTDVCDAQWLQQLHSAGLLKKSFRPARQIAALRYLTRHRAEIVAEGASRSSSCRRS